MPIVTAALEFLRTVNREVTAGVAAPSQPSNRSCTPVYRGRKAGDVCSFRRFHDVIDAAPHDRQHLGRDYDRAAMIRVDIRTRAHTVPAYTLVETRHSTDSTVRHTPAAAHRDSIQDM